MRSRRGAAALVMVLLAISSSTASAVTASRGAATERPDDRPVTAVADGDRAEAFRAFVEANGTAVPVGDLRQEREAPCLASDRYPDHNDVAYMDISFYGVSYYCGSRTWDFFVETWEAFGSYYLYGVVAVEMDRDRNMATGCGGTDTVAAVVPNESDTGFIGEVFAMPSCDEGTWFTVGPVLGIKPDYHSVHVQFAASSIGRDGEFRWLFTVADSRDYLDDEIDHAPSVGWRDMTLPCGVGSTTFRKVTARAVYGVYDDMVGGDFNGDSVDDLFFYGRGSAEDGLLQGSGNGLLAVPYRPPVNGYYDDIVSGDFNGDGADDVFFYGAGSRPDGYLLATPGSFALTPVRGSVQVTRSYDGVAAGDFNGDGLDDVFFYGAGARPDGLLRGTANGLRAVSGSVQVSRVYDDLAAGDFNADGRDDVAFYARGTAPEGLLLGGPTWLHAATPGSANGVYDSMAPGDFNADGYSDLFFYAPGADCEGLLRGTPTTMKGVSTPGVDGTYDAYAGGDFNGDGNDDLFFYGRGSRGEGQLLGQ